jgi:hypothetical protein
VFSDEDLLIAVNSAGLFKFEHFREKKEDEKNEDGFWDERFMNEKLRKVING